MKRLFACLLVLALLLALPLAAMAKPLPAVRIIGPSSFTYSGLPNCPVLQMIDGSYTLVEGVDYTVEYYLNVDVPGGTWTVYPLGIYTNALSDQLIINKAPLPTINAIPDQVYTGSAITPALSLNPALPLDNFNIVYSNNTAAGQAKVTLTSKGSNVEAGSVSANFNIQYLSLPLPPIASLAYTTTPYDGSAKTPAVTITGLVLDRDFTVSYQKNTAVGTAQVSATGMGNYTGVSTASFEITHTHVWGAWKDNDDLKTHSRNCSALPTHSQTADCTFKEELFPPTCTQGGYTQFTCTVCGFGYWDFFTDPTGHTWGDWLNNNDGTHTCTCKTDPSHQKTEDCTLISAVEPPTCTEDGYTQFTCTLCGYGFETGITPKLGHDWGAWVSNDDGSHTHTCKTDPSHKETFDCTFKEEVVPPTCTEGGYTDFTCTACGYGYLDFFTEPTGHTPGNWELIQKATDLREGEELQRCLVCGTPLAFQSLPKLTRIEGRTATLEGEEFPGMMGRDFRIRYRYVPLDVSQEGTQEVRVIASNRYVIGTLAITIKEGQMMLSFKPADDRETVDIHYMTLFHDPAEFVKQDLDVLEENPLPLDTWIPLPESAQATYLFLRFRVGFDVPGKDIISLP